MKLFKALIGRESLRLDLILVCFLVKRETIARDWGIHCRSEICILFNDVTALGVDLDSLAGFVHLSKHLDTLSLDFGKGALLVFGLL